MTLKLEEIRAGNSGKGKWLRVLNYCEGENGGRSLKKTLFVFDIRG